MGCLSSGEGEVVQAGDAEHGLVDAFALEAAVAKDLPVLQPGQGMLYPCPDSAVQRVLRFLLTVQTLLTTPFSVWDERAGTPVAAIGNDRGVAAGQVDA
jgi:hypothetical protein